MWWPMHDYGGGGWFLFILGLIIIGLLVWGIIALSRGGGNHMGMGMGQPRTGQTPLDIAKERYAKGEITKDQFEEIKKNLL
ncbi:MAG: SHOCT domain-containing protein [Dehalogenimonas sp.]